MIPSKEAPLYLLAGEASGDKLGAALMAGLRQRGAGFPFKGVAGPLMQEQGMASLFPMEELSIMGIAEVLPRYFDLKRRIAEVAADVIASNARALVTIDSPDFCLRVAALVKAARPDFPIIHYVAPSVWAWRPKRAQKMARVVDHVLALLPFEPPYMEAAGMSCDFVGHPVVAEPLASAAEAEAFAPKSAPVLLALPGSRRGEVSRLTPIIGEAAALLQQKLPQLQLVLPTIPAVAGLVAELSRDWTVPVRIITDRQEKRAAFARADAAIAASGTVSLELAANGCPMVIGYKLNPMSMWLMRRLARIDTVTLVNLVSETRTVPEFLGSDCRAPALAEALLPLISPSQKRSAQEEAMVLTMERLGRGGLPPGLRAADSVLAAIARLTSSSH